MSYLAITGYCDRPNVAPGETLAFHVDCRTPRKYSAALVRLVNDRDDPRGPEALARRVPSNIDGGYDGFPQWTTTGSFVEVPDPKASLALAQGGALHLFLYATTPGQTQTVIGRFDEAASRGWALVVEDGFLCFVTGDGTTTQRIASPKRLFPEIWYSVAVTLDLSRRTLALSQETRINRVNSRLGRVVALDSNAAASDALRVVPADSGTPLLIAAKAAGRRDGQCLARGNFNGKLDSPKLYGPGAVSSVDELHAGAVPSAARLAHWDFANGITPRGIPSDEATDISGNALHGRCINQPDRAMTGWNWDGHEERFTHCPEQYGALWFHEDSLDDCRWQPSFHLRVPDDLPSGIYAVHLESEGEVDRVPFFVTPPRGTATAKAAFLVSTLTYLAYANSLVMQSSPVAQAIIGVTTTLSAHDLELNENPAKYGLSTYEHHADGRGVQYSSWRRPILAMRPHNRHEYGMVWAFPADLQLVDWLEHQDVPYDVITDHDLDREGAALLRRYNVVLTGSHPEYCTEAMLDAFEDYVAGGGRAMYLGANGFYWITSLHPDKPWLMEVRKGESGDQAWRARSGEYHHSTTGERGGLWRMRGRPPQKIFGTGYGSHGLDVSTGYVPMPDAADPRLAWLMRGVGGDEMIGDFGGINGGAAGLEMDRIDYAQGTPPNAMLIACSFGHRANAMLVPEELYFNRPGANGEEDAGVRADLVFFTTAQGGAVFSTSSIAWCGSLSHNGFDNNVSTLTRNVLQRFAEDGPIEEIV
ncbi:MAG: N,N-dimethylformamidase beta subunit family domain-containing protein [Alphaproteobacteria bacterium]